MPQQTLKKLADILRLQALRDRRFLALYLTSGWAAYISSAVQSESVFYRQFRTLRSPIAQSDSKIPCRYHFQVDYELCACDVILLSSFKTEIVSTSIYSIIFNIADERLNLGKFDFNIWQIALRNLVFLFLSDLGNFLEICQISRKNKTRL